MWGIHRGLTNSVLLAASLALITGMGCTGEDMHIGTAPVETACDDGADDDGDGRVDCLDTDCAEADNCIHFTGSALGPEPPYTRALDLLVVLDNSGDFMLQERVRLQSELRQLIQTLQDTPQGLPDLHLGVTSTDLGTGMFSITYCEEVGGDAGNLLTGTCPNPTGVPYIVDVQPETCEIQRDASGICTSHSCDQSYCYHEPTTVFVEDAATGCPRCRNYQGESLTEVFTCLTDLGTQGCGFEQPLEAMYKALEPWGGSANAGFQREHAQLGVVIITDEDDCSASNPQLFDNTQTAIDSTLGPLSSFRCFEFGITCDENDRLHQGPRYDCAPRDDANALLYPIDRYVQYLQILKAPEMLYLGAIVGPFAGGPVEVGRDTDTDHPQVEPICSVGQNGVQPAIRIEALINAFAPRSRLASICTEPFDSVSQDLVELTGGGSDDPTYFPCFPKPLAGCTDPAAAQGLPGDGAPCNDACLPNCEVFEVFPVDLEGLDEPHEYRHVLPPCLEVCPDGPCPGNTDPALAYAGGRPPAITGYGGGSLPVNACWYVTYGEDCDQSRGARLFVSHRYYLDPDAQFEAYCTAAPLLETSCGDGLDEDEDCLVDGADPDCGG